MDTDLLIGLFGVFLVIFYFVRSEKRKELLKNGIPAKGKVIDLSLEINGQSSVYCPIVRFALEDGTWISEKYSSGTNPASFKKGDEVELLYDVNDPSSFVILNNKIEYLDKVFLIIGLLISLYSAYQILSN